MKRYIVEITETVIDPDFPEFPADETSCWDLMLHSPEYHVRHAKSVVVRDMRTNEVVWTSKK